MNRILDIVANTLSVLFYPLFVPTYGVTLFCYAYSLHADTLPWVWSLIAIVGTLLFTCILPITSIWILKRHGLVTSMQIENARERTMPFLYTIVGFGFWCYLMISVLQSPLFMGFITIGATVAIGLVAVINRFWKISAHLTGFGGLFGGLMTYCLALGAIPTWGTLVLWLGLALSIMYARLRLNAHTPAQVCAGWLLGLSCTFLPYCIYAYA